MFDLSKLVFYFKIECPICKTEMKFSHIVIEEKKGELFCSICNKSVTVPSFENLVAASKTLNDFLGDSINAKYINLVLNEKFELADDVPAAH